MRFEKFASLLEAGVSQHQALEISKVEVEARYPLLQFAISSGAAATEAARFIGQLQQIETEAQAEITQAQQVPLATKRLTLWLPWLGLALAEIAGMNALATLISPAGLILVAMALGLIYLGNWLSGRMIAAAKDSAKEPDQAIIRLSILLGTGIGLDAALRKSGMTRDDPLVQFAIDSGVNPKELLELKAREGLMLWRTQSLSAAKSLAVKLMIPLGLTTLPAFFLVTVVPILLGAINQ